MTFGKFIDAIQPVAGLDYETGGMPEERRKYLARDVSTSRLTTLHPFTVCSKLFPELNADPGRRNTSLQVSLISVKSGIDVQSESAASYRQKEILEERIWQCLPWSSSCNSLQG